MARQLLYLLVACVFQFPTVAAAQQRGLQVFDFFLQEAQRELQRQEQRDVERAQRQDRQRLHQQFAVEWQACHGGDVSACERGLAYSGLNLNDRQALSQRRARIMVEVQAATDRTRRESEEAARRDRIRELDRQREAAERDRQRAQQAEQERASMAAQLLALQQEQERARASMLIWAQSSFLGLCFAGLLTFLWFRRRALVSPAAGSRRSPPMSATSSLPSSEMPFEHVPDQSPAQPPTRPAMVTPLDSAGAIAALELAMAYIDEVRAANAPAYDDADGRKQQLNTLSLAAKQLDLAQKLDPDAVLEIQDAGVRLTLNEIKAEALLLEGITHQSYDLRRAIPALVAATKLDPSSPRASYVLGLVHASNRNKQAAISALQAAVALDPKNIAYRKELNRVENLSGAEIAAFKVIRAGEQAVDAAALSWNIFAVVWNIVMFPLRVVVGAFRMLRLTGFH